MTVGFDANTFDVNEQQGCIAIQAPAGDVSLTANQLLLGAGVQTAKPLVRPFGNPSFTETGTLTVPAPIVTPALHAPASTVAVHPTPSSNPHVAS